MTTSDLKAVLVAGSANLDVVVRAAHVPAPGETVLGRDVARFAGGKGANQAVACARAGGAATQMLLALGDDDDGRVLERALADAGVLLHIVRVPHEPTGTAFICLADDAENAITVAPGANSTLGPAHLPSLDRFSHLLMQLETPIATVAGYARAARAAGVTTALNAAPAQALPQALVDDIDILIVNEGELVALAGRGDSIADAAARLDVPCLIVTLGRLGAVARVDGRFIAQPGFAVDALDTTGAGDTFCGALVAALHRGRTLADAMRHAGAAAALACRAIGAQSSIPGHDAVAAFLAAGPPTTGPVRDLEARCGLPERTPS